MLPILNTGAFTQADVSAILANAQAGQWTGNTYYIDPVNGLDLNNGQQAQATPGQQGTGPVKSLQAGYALLVGGNNDTLVIIGNGTTAATVRLDASFTWAKNNCRILGICAPARFSQRARIAPTGTTTAFTPFFTVSGSGNLFQNIQWFHGFNTGTTAQICMVITGSRNVFQNCAIDGMGDTTSATSATSRTLVISQDENLFQSCSIGVDTIQRTGANSTIEFTGGAARNVFENCLFPFDGGAGGAPLGVKALTGGIDRFNLFNQCLFINAINSGGTSMTSLGSIGANGGGPNGIIVYKNSTLVGIAEWEATTKTSVYVDGPAVSSSAGIGVNPA